MVHPIIQRIDPWRFDGRGHRERGLLVECHTKEFCVKVLKFEIVNSRKSFNYFSRVVLRTIEFVHSVLLFLGGLKMARLKIEKTIPDL